MNEEELKAKEEELKAKEEELKAKEEELKNNDTTALITELKEGYENKLLQQQQKFSKQINEQKNVIKQLLLGNDDANKSKPTIIDKINARRSAQNKKW